MRLQLSDYPILAAADTCWHYGSDICFSYSDTHPHGDCGDEDSEAGMQDMTEMRFVPDDKGMLDAMFHAMSECQSLHPDSQDSFSEGLYLFSINCLHNIKWNDVRLMNIISINLSIIQ